MSPGSPTEDQLAVEALADDDHDWAARLVEDHWGSVNIVTRGIVHNVMSLPGFVARRGPDRLGLATYEIRGDQCELVSLDVVAKRKGVGTALLRAVQRAAQKAGCRRLWLITTNDNLDALRFYQRRGFCLWAVHPNALSLSRQLKKTIPEVGEFGIPLRDEIELEILLR